MTARMAFSIVVLLACGSPAPDAGIDAATGVDAAAGDSGAEVDAHPCRAGTTWCEDGVYVHCGAGGSRTEETCEGDCLAGPGCVACIGGSRRCRGTVSEECAGGVYVAESDCAEWNAECAPSTGACDVPADLCRVDPSLGDAPGRCVSAVAPGDFDPVLEWTWEIDAISWGHGSVVPPLVANFDDDNGDGVVDLCDVPDVLVTTLTNISSADGELQLVSDRGEETLRFEESVYATMTPAIADIDGDGLVEVVAVAPPDAETPAHLLAFENTGELKWRGDVVNSPDGRIVEWFPGLRCSAVSIHDLDGDGDVEIIVGFQVYDHRGRRLFGRNIDSRTEAEWSSYRWVCATAAAADLDGDGRLEVIFGHEAWNADGEILWTVPGVMPGHPHVANLDSDPEPEIVLSTMDGVYVIEHDGTIAMGPTLVRHLSSASNAGAIAELDGSGPPEIVLGFPPFFAAVEVTDSLASRWTHLGTEILSPSTATAFDFFGDGAAEAIYQDDHYLRVLDGNSGDALASLELTSYAEITFPVVADVDNDGSAEILVTSHAPDASSSDYPLTTLHVFGNRSGSWAPARRIWNQHAYDPSMVREDGTIPATPESSWLGHNTFRVNAPPQPSASCLY